MDAESDVTLVDRARSGDRGAFALLLDRHRPVLLALCRRALGDALLAEDAAQEASLQAFLSLDRLERDARFGPWLHGIGLNICRRLLRLRSRDLWSWEALLGGGYGDEPADRGPGPAEIVEEADLQARVRHAVAALPRGQRAAVMLFYLDGLSHDETAAVLGIGAGAVKTRLHKARATLRQTLWNTWKEHEMATEAETGLVEMRVSDVWRPPREGDQPRNTVVVLAEIGGARRFSMWIGSWEGEALAMTMEKLEVPRPLTYTFTARLLEASGCQLREVRIVRLSERTYFAEAEIDGPAGRRTVDCRPSDALNLALLVGAPIRVAPAVIEQGARPLAWEDMVQQAQKAGVPAEQLPSQEQYDQIRKVISGETTGGAAAIVAEIRG
jgi:RNA polymerase sigma-70 factor (ECF subfamily)